MTTTSKPQIPWLRVFVEGVVIVGSILLAFGIDAWWEEGRDREEESEALAGLLSDFTAIEQDLEQGLDRATQRAAGIDWLLSLSQVPAHEIPVSRADTTFRVLTITGTYEPSEATLDGLITSGSLDLLHHRDLRRRLSAWRRLLDEVQDGEATMRSYDRDTLVPYLARAGLPLLRSRGGPRLDIDESSARAIYSRIVRDVEFQALATYKANWMSATAAE